MKIELRRMGIHTHQDNELIDITDVVRATVRETKLATGIAYISTLHTTSGITVNEGLPDVEADIVGMLSRVAPEGGRYQHGRFLHSDGQMAVNSVSHQRAAVLGMQVAFAIENGDLVMGSRQRIYFAELDGPLFREYLIHILGE